MDRLITATKANQRFSELLRDVQSGESFVVTSRGEPVARVVPVEADRKDQKKRIDDLLELLKQQPHRIVGPWKREDLYD